MLRYSGDGAWCAPETSCVYTIRGRACRARPYARGGIMIRRPFLNMVLVAGGLWLLISGLILWLGVAPAHAQGQPPPRPTLTPAPPTSVPPTSVPHSDHSSPTAVPAG